ncbi:MAG: hypothetical protein QM722_10010 [Piscinibacter sp.]
MLPRPTDLLHTSVVISELPAVPRMPAPTPLPTLRQPGWIEQVGAWLAARRDAQPLLPRRSAQVLMLRA